MAYGKKRSCPREAYLKGSLPFGATKHSALKGIMKRVIMQTDPSKTTEKDIKALVNQEFSSANATMLSFEREQEQSRMEFLLCRWLNWEKSHLSSSKILSRNFSSKIVFAGDNKTQRVHWLADRGGALEAVLFNYKQPEFSSRGRSLTTKPCGSPQLLMLQRAGEAEAARLGIDTTKKPVFGSIYYIKSRSDTAKVFTPSFEDSPEQNIISHCFTANEAKAVEDEYDKVAPDPNKTCEESECRDCQYFSLCHAVFEKRHKMERPPVELKTIDSITLTDAQLSFISFREGECRVNAVAGSGKTTIVTLRTLGLLEEGTDPTKILMVTFSEKAKEEMALRLRSFAEGRIMEGANLDVKNVRVETFNSWGQKVLNDNYALLGFTGQPTLVDDISKKDIIIRLLEKHRSLPLDYRNPFMSTRAAEGAVVKLGKWIDTMKSAHVETENDVLEVLGVAVNSVAAELLDIYKEYNKELLAINAIDYEDQLRLLLKLADHGIFEKMPYEHIVVDEFQDSNPNQIAIILELKKRNPRVKSLVVVGDELQAIYGFRNASPENLVAFGSYFPHMVDIDLTANFRSQAPIIQLANKIIHRTAQLGKAIEAHKKNSKVQPAIINVKNDDQELSLYTRQVKKLIRDGVAPSSIAILCRTRAELIKQQQMLDKAGVPTILKVPEIIADEPFVKAVIGLASYIQDNADLASLGLYAKSLGQDPFDTATLKASGDAVMKALDACKSEQAKIDIFMEFAKDACEDYVAETLVEKMKRLNFTTISQYLAYCTKYRDYGIRDTVSTAQEQTDCVTLITTHSAKGLEWDIVLLSLKRFPIDEESQRLFYVGVTRAKEKLLVTYTDKQLLLADLIDAAA